MEIERFKRIEKKYRMSKKQYSLLFSRLQPLLVPDRYWKSTIQSLYLDTDNYQMIRNSIEATNYKEKIRIRCYGAYQPGDRVFVELKKKYDGIVYKRRCGMSLDEAMSWIRYGNTPIDSQIVREISYTMKNYGSIKPSMMITYEREAYNILGYPNLRITFDQNIRFRTRQLSPKYEITGRQLLNNDDVLMEFKTDSAMPLCIVHALEDIGIKGVSFSKYGTAYTQLFEQKKSIENSVQEENKIKFCS